jgi:uncharacterized protein YegL
MAKAVKKTAKKAAPKRITKKKITNLIIIDASGSMASKVAEVQGGLKQLFSDIRKDMIKDKKTVNMRNIVLDFSGSGDIRTLVDSNDVNDLQDSLADKYRVRGMTALLDAIGKGMSMVDSKDYAVFVSILTDGEENDSKQYTSKDVTEMIKAAKDKKWVVTFMGTTEAAINKAQSWGVSRGNTMTFSDDSRGVKMSMKKSTLTRTAYYAAATGTSGFSGASGQTLDNLLSSVKDDEDEKLNNVTNKTK